MYCSFCGKEIDNNASVCVNCGRKTQVYKEPQKPLEANQTLYFWIGFLVPMAGFFIWVFTHDETPLCAHKALMGAIWGTVAVVLAVVLIYVLFFALIFLGISQMY